MGDQAVVDVVAFQRFEREGWDRVAHRYDEVWSPLTRQFVEPLLEAAGVEAGQRVLDLACGPGYVAAAAAARGAVVSATDLSPAMVAEARRRHPGLEVRVAAAERIELPDGCLDRVLMSFGIVHLADPLACFAEARRVLRRGGRFALTVWAAAAESPGACVLERAIERHALPAADLPAGPGYYHYADPERLRGALAACGFAGKVETELLRRRWRVPDPAYVFAAEREAGVRTSALLARQPAERLAAIAAAIAEGLAGYRDDDGYAVPMHAWVVAATA